MTALVIPSHLTSRQHSASNPESSIWVSANAGSGKTHVLTQRVMRLLLMGVEPSKILCLTFTKAAAAEMSARVFKALSDWTALDDDKLRAEIAKTGAPSPDGPGLVRARRLFTRTVETPGGLKIQTIHAFCERLLHLFPFEANVSARFEVADDKRTEEMLSLAKSAAIAAAQRFEGRPAEALATIAEAAGSLGLDPVLGVAMRLRKAARRTRPDPQVRLARRLGAGNLVSVADVHRAMVEGIATGQWREIAAFLATGSKSDVARGAEIDAMRAALQGGAALADIVPDYLGVFFTQKGERRGALMTKALASRRPDVAQDLEAEQTRLVGLREQLKVAETIERTEALVTIVDDIIARYDTAKAAAGLLDFDDLIDRTRVLLERSDAGWVLHKLDSGIDHVLVDEAQDTSEAQWKILEKLTDDFASGAGARPDSRSFFVVGDEKQSIFSFQGAAPLMFDAMRSDFERRFRQGGMPFARVALNASFRSTPGILKAVDAMFEPAGHRDGLVALQDDWTPHESLKPALPSLVEIWSPIKASETPEPEDWTIPLDLEGENDPPSQLADRVARKIKLLTAPASGEHVRDAAGQPREISPGDILVLVRTRNAFFEAVIRALKAQGVPVAGADRLDVANHIAVMDLVAAGRAALLPQDDLALACVLKSPLFGFGDDDLLALAPGRKGPLVAALAGSLEARHKDAHHTIARWSARAAGATPFAFYVELLGRDGGRLKMEARLGPEAHNAIDEFLRLALEHEAAAAPSLTSFLADVEALESSIKRDMEGRGASVRVMTVHAAKGLEAKIVFLPDTCATPTARLDPPVFDLAEDGAAPLLVWSPRGGDDPAPVAEARQRQRDAAMREYRRLLYVAMTRAEERLYLAGFYNIKEPPDDCWAAMIQAVFGEAEEVPAFWDAAETVRRIHTPGAPIAGAAPRALHEQGRFPTPPPWLNLAVAPAAAPNAPQRATRVAAAPSPERRQALAYGEALHLLLQALPAHPPAAREAAARAFLAARPGLAPDAARDDLVAEALAVIALPELAPLFGPTARAEVAVLGRAVQADGREIAVSGQVDRLVVTPDAVLVADFKSGPAHDTVPADYCRQMDLYRSVLAPLWPDRPLRLLLVWTSVPKVVALDPAS